MKMDSVGNLCIWCLEDIGDAPVCPHCGHGRGLLTSEKEYLQPGTLLHEHYLIGRVLGVGGFGITYLAYDSQLLAKRAIKEFYPHGLVFRPDHVSIKTFSTTQNESFQKGLESFHKEALTLAKFGTHPNVVRTHDYFEENGTAYLVMDYVEGESFGEYLEAHGEKLSWEETRRILSPIGDVLSTLHKEGLLHRDVKPDNIYITREGNAILLDFGSARYTNSDGQSKGMTAIMTPGYTPMEQYGRNNQGTWTDVYAYAATFYRALSGSTPPVSTDRLGKEDPLVPLCQLDKNIPVFVSDAVSRAMAAQISERTQTVAEFLAGLSGSATGAGEEKSSKKQKNAKICPHCHTALGKDSVCPSCGYNARKPHASSRKPKEQTGNVKASLVKTDRSGTAKRNPSSKKWVWIVLAVLAAGMVFWSVKNVFLTQPEPVNIPLPTAAAEPTADAAPTATAVPTEAPTPLLVPTSTPVEEVSYEVFNATQGGAYWYRKPNDVAEKLGWLWNGAQVELQGEENETNGKQWMKILIESKGEGWILRSNIKEQN